MCFFFQAEDGIRDSSVTGVQTCALPISSHFGGTRNGLVISWPKRIKKTGEVRTQFCSIIDIAPTILEAAGVKEPTMVNGVNQTPIEGISLGYSFDAAKAPTRHKTQYLAMIANPGVYQD